MKRLKTTTWLIIGKNMKLTLTIISFVLMVAALIIAWFLKSKFWESVAINAATSFMALGVGLIFVNIYLERHARKGAVRSLLVLSHTAIGDFHDALLDIGWARFGRDQWGNFIKEYMDAGGQPEALRQEVRDFLYNTVKDNTALARKIDKLEETLAELSRMVGWDLDPQLLQHCLDSRIAVAHLKRTDSDGSAAAKDQVTEHLLDADIQSQIAQRILMDIAGIA